MAPTTIVGIDLSGPANAADTALIIGHATAESLELYESRLGVSDTSILALARKLAAGPAVLALDAPLSYNEGGGDRPSDRHLRRKIIDAGMASGSVMSPTMTRMAYLTLRGIAVARGIQSVAGPTVRIVEVHPGATMALRGAPIEAVRGFAKQPEARTELLRWLGTPWGRHKTPVTRPKVALGHAGDDGRGIAPDPRPERGGEFADGGLRGLDGRDH